LCAVSLRVFGEQWQADTESDQIDEDRQEYNQQGRTRLHVVLAVWIFSTAIGNRRLPGLLPADNK
jgi:Ser-tRNA(Ala) deacylase AlaX